MTHKTKLTPERAVKWTYSPAGDPTGTRMALGIRNRLAFSSNEKVVEVWMVGSRSWVVDREKYDPTKNAGFKPCKPQLVSLPFAAISPFPLTPAELFYVESCWEEVQKAQATA